MTDKTNANSQPSFVLARLRAAIFLLLSFLCSFTLSASDNKTLVDQVKQTEIAFAKTMRDRDFKAFQSFLSEAAVFLDNKKESRGKEEISKVWSAFFETPTAPFSWEPEIVVVLNSGKLALSTGPVQNTQGDLIAHYTSTWRLEDDGKWRIIFDKGNIACH